MAMTINEAKISNAADEVYLVKKQMFFLGLATVLALIPFLTKPIHIDDPLFIWVAERIITNPWDFFGFDVNWYGHEASMAEVNKNPPLSSYFIAICATIFGWSEIALHIAFMLPAVSLILGTYKLAQIFGANPFGVSLSLLCCPVVVLSSTTLMVDIFMLSLWVWAIVFWINGIDNQSRKALLFSGILITLAALSKYIAISLIPLLLVYSLLVEKKFTKNSAMLIVPLFFISLFILFMYIQYGQNFLTNIFGFSVGFRIEDSVSVSDIFLVGMIFLGGGLLFPVFYIFHLFTKNKLFWAIALLGLLVLGFYMAGNIGVTEFKNSDGFRYELLLQSALFFLIGALCIYLLYCELKDQNRPLSWLLFLWITGVLFFALFLNWSINGRSILPVVPAISILLWRQLGAVKKIPQKIPVKMLLPLFPAFIISIAITWADYRLASAVQEAAVYSARSFKSSGNALWLQGAWGFQYYMQRYGANRLVINESMLQRGDWLVIPTNNSNIFPVPQDRFKVVEIKEFETVSWASVLSRLAGAGFYTSMAGSLPYTIGQGHPEVYYILEVVKPWKVSTAKS
jgi:4-amino-4-deoxy-L-arabinose transferase-like glycosyltransferase